MRLQYVWRKVCEINLFITNLSICKFRGLEYNIDLGSRTQLHKFISLESMSHLPWSKRLITKHLRFPSQISSISHNIYEQLKSRQIYVQDKNLNRKTCWNERQFGWCSASLHHLCRTLIIWSYVSIEFMKLL